MFARTKLGFFRGDLSGLLVELSISDLNGDAPADLEALRIVFDL